MCLFDVMKFAKELEQDLVPEWKIKYLDYKAGKKYVKAVSRAIQKANGTPLAAHALGYSKKTGLPPHDTPTFLQSPFASESRNVEQNGDGSKTNADLGPGPMDRSKAPNNGMPRTVPIPPPAPRRTENLPLKSSPGNEGYYGSFIPTPPSDSPLATMGGRNPLELPAPAMKMNSNQNESSMRPTDTLRKSFSQRVVKHSMSASTALDVPGGSGNGSRGQFSTFPRESPASNSSSGRLHRIFSTGPNFIGKDNNKRVEYSLQAIDSVRQREHEFFEFLDRELDKVETFYAQKEEQAGQRLYVLRDQLHEMRNRRIEELAEMKRRKEQRQLENSDNSNGESKTPRAKGSQNWIDPIKSKIFKPGPNSKALMTMARTPMFEARGRVGDGGRDYVRRPEHDVPYRTAKRKLKLALQEFYRGLELLKSYTILNRTAFRKLNKKYDKAVNARPPYRYMNEKVNKAWFVNSDVLDGHIKAVEDLYARYFEKGNHKIAAGKLRRLTRRPGDRSGSTFLNGLFIGIGSVFTFQGLVYGAQLLFDEDEVVRINTSYLMQIYGGYFLMLLLFSYFCLDCYVWTVNKVNYPFIFEFDTRHNLDWRQLSQFPSFCWMLFGVFTWLNFTRYGSPDMYLYYPVILIGLTLLLLLFPAPVLAHRSRQWILYSHYRLFFAGWYPVEFRDFFLGDIYCSLTYATANIELVFCLYAHYWNEPDQCNSSHSPLMGFLATLPPIWRALQCIRRYKDTKNVFPHLVNCGKYGITIMSGVALSLYRINGTKGNLASFVTFSIMNSIYTCVWDLLMDFSLLQQDARHPLLRDILALKRRWIYYIIMVADPLLRWSWIFYAIFTYDKQHSTFVSFLIALGEVTRRGMWALLRVENEHCANVAQYKASRDVPLPYRLDHEPLVAGVSTDSVTGGAAVRREEAVASAVHVGGPARGTPRSGRDTAAAATGATGVAATTPETPSSTTTADESGAGGLRLRRGRSDVAGGGVAGASPGAGGTIRRIIAEAHKQDFEKRRRPADAAAMHHQDVVDDEDELPVSDDASDEEDDDDEDDTASVADERREVREAEELINGEGDDNDNSKGARR